MIGIVVAGYGSFAEHLLIALQVSKGKQENIYAVEIAPSNDKGMIEKNRQALLKAITSVDQGQGVIVCTDSMQEDAGMIAQSLTQEVVIEIISGVNLPMLVEIALLRGQKSMQECAAQAVDAARKSIVRHTTGPDL